MSTLENSYQGRLIKKIKRLLPGSVVLKNDANYLAQIPDLTVFYGSNWAVLEVKRSAKEAEDAHPNQKWYVREMNAMSFAAFIYPENEKEVLHDLQRSLQSRR